MCNKIYMDYSYAFSLTVIVFSILSVHYNEVSSQTTLPPVTATNENYVIPETDFDCKTRSPGFYADVDPLVRCRVYHFCSFRRKKTSFACPPGTLFHQQFLICAHAREVNCSMSPHFYKVNLDVYSENIVTGKPQKSNDLTPKPRIPRPTQFRGRNFETTTLKIRKIAPPTEAVVSIDTPNTNEQPTVESVTIQQENVNNSLTNTQSLEDITLIPPDFFGAETPPANAQNPIFSNLKPNTSAIIPGNVRSKPLSIISKTPKTTTVKAQKSRTTTRKSILNARITTKAKTSIKPPTTSFTTPIIITTTLEQVSDTPSPPLPESPPLPPEPYVPSSSSSSETLLPKTSPATSQRQTVDRFSSAITTAFSSSRSSFRTPSPGNGRSQTLPETAAIPPTARFPTAGNRWNFPVTSTPVKEATRLRPGASIAANAVTKNAFSPRVGSAISPNLGFGESFKSNPRENDNRLPSGRNNSTEIGRNRGISQELGPARGISRELVNARGSSRELGPPRGISVPLTPRIISADQEPPAIRRLIVSAGIGLSGPGSSRPSRPVASGTSRLLSDIRTSRPVSDVRPNSSPLIPSATIPPLIAPQLTTTRPSRPVFVDNNHLTVKFPNRTKFVDPKIRPNPRCPTCDPLFLDPGQCTPCVRIR